MTKEQREWDGYDGYLFDIDGTLLTCRDLVHYRAFNSALSEVAGKQITIDGVVMHGNVDVGIMRDTFLLHGVSESVWRPHRSWIIEVMGEYVARYSADLEFTVLPQVPETLQHLKRRGALLGTATGNLSSIGTIKLQRAGLWHWFDFGGWSDAYESRADIVKAAAEQARSRLGSAATLCMVGDTPSDILAAQACGLDVIAVATGIYQQDDLRSKLPNFLVHSLAELHTGSSASTQS